MYRIFRFFAVGGCSSLPIFIGGMIKKIISNYRGGVFLKRNISTIFEGEFLRRAFSVLSILLGEGGFVFWRREIS